MLHQTVERFVDSPWIGVELGQKRIASKIVRNCGRKRRASFLIHLCISNADGVKIV